MSELLDLIDRFSQIATHSPQAPTSTDTNTLPNETIELNTDTTKEMPRLPGEVIGIIFHFLDKPTLLSTIKVNKAFYTLSIPVFYDTIHLNRNTLPGLARWMNGEMMERKKELLAKVKTLVIDDIQVMFCCTYDADLKMFCDTIVLPNVTKLVWRQDKLRPIEQESPEPIEERKGYWVYPDQPQSRGRTCGNELSMRGRWVSTEPPLPPFNPTLERPTRIGRSSRIEEFAKVLTSSKKTICIRLPPSGTFQLLGPIMRYHHSSVPSPHYPKVTDRIMSYLVKLLGDITIQIHQPITPEHLTLAEVPGATTTYSFYPNSTNATAKAQLIEAWERAMRQRLRRYGRNWPVWSDTLAPAITEVLEGDLDQGGMVQACIALIRRHAFALTSTARVTTATISEVLSVGVTEMVAALHSIQESKCHYCGDKGGDVEM